MKRDCNFYSNTYIEYDSNGVRNKKLSIKDYLDKIKPYLKKIILDLQKQMRRKFNQQYQ